MPHYVDTRLMKLVVAPRSRAVPASCQVIDAGTVFTLTDVLRHGMQLSAPMAESLLSGNAELFRNQTFSTESSSRDCAEVIGSNGRVKIVGGLVEITRDLKHDIGLGNLRGTKSIPIRAVQAVQFKRATAWVGGAIEFVVAGDRSNTGHDFAGLGNAGAEMLFGRQLARMGNENVVTFTLKQEPPFLALHKLVLSLISNGRPGPSPAVIEQRTDLVAQLEQLRQLHTDGVLTEDEFGRAKARLLNEK